MGHPVGWVVGNINPFTEFIPASYDHALLLGDSADEDDRALASDHAELAEGPFGQRLMGSTRSPRLPVRTWRCSSAIGVPKPPKRG